MKRFFANQSRSRVLNFELLEVRSLMAASIASGISGSWFVEDTWKDGAIPTSSDDAEFSDDANYTIQLLVKITPGDVRIPAGATSVNVTDGSVALNLRDNEFTLGNLYSPGNTTIGGAGGASLLVFNDTNGDPLEGNAASYNTYTVNVGNVSQGILTVEGTHFFVSNELYAGRGNGGSGSVHITDDADVTVGNDAYIGVDAGWGWLTIDSGSFDTSVSSAQAFFVGTKKTGAAAGTGTVAVNANGVMRTGFAVIGGGGGEGILVVDGGTWSARTNTNPALRNDFVSYDLDLLRHVPTGLVLAEIRIGTTGGTGTVTVEDGGHVEASVIGLGLDDGGAGILRIIGSGSRVITTGRLHTESLTAQPTGSAKIEIKDGGMLYVEDIYFFPDDHADSQILVDAGQVRSRDTWIGVEQGAKNRHNVELEDGGIWMGRNLTINRSGFFDGIDGAVIIEQEIRNKTGGTFKGKNIAAADAAFQNFGRFFVDAGGTIEIETLENSGTMFFGAGSGDFTQDDYNPTTIANVTMAGSFTQGESGVMKMQLGVTGYSDQLTINKLDSVGGKFTAGGTLKVTALDELYKSLGASYDLVIADDVDGKFADLILPEFDSSSTLTWQVEYGDLANDNFEYVRLKVVNKSLNQVASVVEGGTATLTGTIGVGSASDNVIIDWGDGQSQTVALAAHYLNATHVYVDDGLTNAPSDTYTITVTHVDPNQDVTTDLSVSVTVENAVPLVTIDYFTGGNEGGTAGYAGMVTGSFTDAGVSDTHEVVIDWGDGNTQTVGHSGSTFNASHTYADNNQAGYGANGYDYQVKVSVIDDDGGTGTAVAGVGVANLPPELASMTLADAPAVEGGAVTISGEATDPGNDAVTVVIDWGDGVTTTQSPASDDTFSKSHSYADNGIYSVSVKAIDDEGASDIWSTGVTVTNAIPVVTISSTWGGAEGGYEGSIRTLSYTLTGRNESRHFTRRHSAEFGSLAV